MARQQFEIPKSGLLIPLAIAVIFLFRICTETIKSGQAGVLYKTLSGGVVTDKPPKGEGFHFILPWDKIHIYEVREQSIKEELPELLSVDGLPIEVDLTIQFKPNYENLGNLHKKIGKDYYLRKIKPAINSVARRIIGQYTAEELYSSKKNSIQNEIQIKTMSDLKISFIDLIQVLVEKIELPKKITDAIEDKKTKEQELEKYKYLLQTAEKEAERQRIEAKGKADANRILSASLTDKILQDKGIEATNKLSESSNSKVVIIGSGKTGMPIILGNQ